MCNSNEILGAIKQILRLSPKYNLLLILRGGIEPNV